MQSWKISSRWRKKSIIGNLTPSSWWYDYLSQSFKSKPYVLFHWTSWLVKCNRCKSCLGQFISLGTSLKKFLKKSVPSIKVCTVGDHIHRFVPLRNAYNSLFKTLAMLNPHISLFSYRSSQIHCVLKVKKWSHCKISLEMRIKKTFDASKCIDDHITIAL